jgi:hypothetical protein
MKSIFPAALFLASAVASLGAFADDLKRSPAATLAVPEDVRVQPRRPGFALHSSEVDDLQRSITDFNAKQQALDAMFDRKLNICRRC